MLEGATLKNSRIVAPILLGVGAFLVVIAALMRFYAYPHVAVAPADQVSTTHLQAKDATIFDTSKLEPIVTDLSIVAETLGNVEASEKADDGVVVWRTTQVVTSEDGVERSASVEYAAFDEKTAEAVNCCGGYDSDVEGEQTFPERKGLLFKFPFDTQKKDYELWDGTLGDTATAEFDEETEIDGLTVYKFTMTVPQTVVGTRSVPASVIDLADDPRIDEDGNIEADETYALERTIWVEPNTGAIIDDVRDQLQTIALDGADRLTRTDAVIEYTDDQVAENVDEYGSLGPLLGNLHGLFPLLALLIGLGLIAGGALLRRGRTSPAPSSNSAPTRAKASA